MALDAGAFRWIRRNSRVLTLAVSVLSALAAGIVWLYPKVGAIFRSDLTLTVERLESTTPPDLVIWGRDAAIRIQRLHEDAAEDTTGVLEPHGIDQLADAATAQRLQRWFGGVEVLRLDVRNNTSRTIDDVHLRLEGVGPVWSLAASGTFLPQEQAADFVGKFRIPEGFRSDVVFPELPPLPPRGELRLLLYALEAPRSEPQLTAPNTSVRIERIIRIRRGWIVGILEEPWRLLGMLSNILIATSLVFLTLAILVPLLRSRRRPSGAPGE